MPIKTSLVEDGHIIHQVVSDPWTMTELLETELKIEAYLAQAQHMIHLLADISQMHKLQPGLLRASKRTVLEHPLFGSIAIIGASTIARSIGEAIFRITRFERGHYFKQEADAWAFLRSQINGENTPP
jgi:hypothetical protein